MSGYRITGSDSPGHRPEPDGGAFDASGAAHCSSEAESSLLPGDDMASDHLSALLNAISADISDRGKGMAAAIHASFASRIDAARRGHSLPGQASATIMGLKHERDAALRAIAESVAGERAGRIAAALQGRQSQQRRHGGLDQHGRGRPQPAGPSATRAGLTKSFRLAAAAALAPAAGTPRARRRRGGGSGTVSFRPAANALLFRATPLPDEAYGTAIAFLSDTLHWLELWHDPAAGTVEAGAEDRMQNLLFPSL